MCSIFSLFGSACSVYLVQDGEYLISEQYVGKDHAVNYEAII